MKTISLLTTDLLGERSYSINYHLLLSLRQFCDFNAEWKFVIYTCEVNSIHQNSIIQTMCYYDIDLPLDRISIITYDYRDIINVAKMLARSDAIFSEMYVWSECIKKTCEINPNIKIAYWVHSLLQQEFICNRHAKWIDYELYISMQQELISLADIVIYDSKLDMVNSSMFYWKDLSKSTYIYPIPKGCFSSKDRLFNLSETKIIYPGRWEYRKGLEYLIKAVFKLYVEDNIKSYILSDMNYITDYEALFTDKTTLHIFQCMVESGIIELIPWFNYQDDYIKFLSNQSLIAVIPSLYDPFNIVAYDCIRNNVPLVLSNYCGVTELVNDTIMVERVNPYDSMSIYNGVKNIINRIESNDMLISNGAVDYDIKMVEKQLKAICKKLKLL